MRDTTPQAKHSYIEVTDRTKDQRLIGIQIIACMQTICRETSIPWPVDLDLWLH